MIITKDDVVIYKLVHDNGDVEFIPANRVHEKYINEITENNISMQLATLKEKEWLLENSK